MLISKNNTLFLAIVVLQPFLNSNASESNTIPTKSSVKFGHALKEKNEEYEEFLALDSSSDSEDAAADWNRSFARLESLLDSDSTSAPLRVAARICTPAIKVKIEKELAAYASSPTSPKSDSLKVVTAPVDNAAASSAPISVRSFDSGTTYSSTRSAKSEDFSNILSSSDKK